MATPRQIGIAYARSRAAYIVATLEMWKCGLSPEEELIASEEMKEIANRINRTINYEHLEEYNSRVYPQNS